MAAMLASRSRRLAAGERPIGWKLGFGAPIWLDRFELTGPLVGFLTDATNHPSGAMVSCEGWSNPVAEPEIAVYVGRDVDDPTRVADAIAALGPAIELADVHSPPESIEDVLAGNIFHRAVVLGDPDPARAGGLRVGLRARIRRDGVEVADTTDLESATGDLVEILGHAAALLAASGERLRSGDVVIMGSVIPPLPVSPGTVVGFRLSESPEITVEV